MRPKVCRRHVQAYNYRSNIVSDDDIRAYLEAQREIDQVLGAPNTLPDVFVENR